MFNLDLIQVVDLSIIFYSLLTCSYLSIKKVHGKFVITYEYKGKNYKD